MSAFSGLPDSFRRFFFSPPQKLGVEFDVLHTNVMNKGKLIFHEPTCLAYARDNGSVFAIGKRAAQLFGRTPTWIHTLYLLENDRVVDTKLWQQYTQTIFKNLPLRQLFWQKHKIAVAIPVLMPRVHRLVIQESMDSWYGAAQLYSRAEAAFQSLYVQKQVGQTTCVLVLGDQSSEIGFFSQGQMIKVIGLTIGWKSFVEATIKMMRETHQLVMSQATAYRLTKELGAVHYNQASSKTEEKKTTVRAKNILTHLPETIVISAQELMPAWDLLVDQLLTEITQGLNEINPDVLSEAFETGISITGTHSQIEGLPGRLAAAFDADVRFSETSTLDVVRGAQLLALQVV